MSHKYTTGVGAKQEYLSLLLLFSFPIREFIYILKTFYIYEPQSRRGRKGKKKIKFHQSFNLAIELVEMQG